MKANKKWQEQWEQINVPDKKLEAMIEQTMRQEKKKKKKPFFKRSLYRNLLIAAAALVLIVAGGSLLLSKMGQSTSSYSSLSTKNNDYSQKAADTNGNPADNDSQVGINSDKKAYFYTISKETQNFTTDVKKLETLTDQLGGYLETSSQRDSNDSLSADLKLRIPTAKNQAFLKALDAIGTTSSQEMSSVNYSLEYSDNESQIKALKTEETALLKMLEKSSTVSDSLKIQEQLTKIRSEREQLTKSNKVIDNQVDFSTFSIHITESAEIHKDKNKTSVLSRIKNNWASQLQGWKQFFMNLLVGLASYGIYLFAIFLIIGGIIFYRKKHQ